MRSPFFTRLVTLVLAAGLVAAPAAASPGGDRRDVEARLVGLGAAPSEAKSAAARLTEADLAVLASHPGMLQRAGVDAARVVESRLAALGHAPAAAREITVRLTASDLAVLAAHPGMMQEAGALDNTTLAIIVGVLIIAGIIVIGLASDSAFVTF